MKNTIALCILGILLGACNNAPQKSSSTNTTDTSNTQNKTVLPTDDNKTKTRIPNAYFKITLVKKEENKDERIGTESESVVELWVDQNKIDSYDEFGDGEIFEDGLQANLNSEMSEKIYTIELKDSLNFKVNYVMIFEGEEKQLWNKSYAKSPSKGWEMKDCKGECD